MASPFNIDLPASDAPWWPLDTAWLLPKGLPTVDLQEFLEHEKPSLHPHFENVFKQDPEGFRTEQKVGWIARTETRAQLRRSAVLWVVCPGWPIYSAQPQH